jgi:hypothetical protein
VNVYTATERRSEVAAVWCAAVRATLLDRHETFAAYQMEPPVGCDRTFPIHHAGAAAGPWIIRTVLPGAGIRLFIEEDMIPVLPWSVDDYPGELLYAEGSPNNPWPSFYLARGRRGAPIALVPQRFVRDGGCPDWLPADLCEPALRANAKVLGRHFLHLDKMYRPNVPEAAAKNDLLELLRQRFADAPPARPGLGDMVSAGLSAIGITPERVSKVLGVKDCGCKKRAEALNRIGRRIGIG